MRVHQHAPIGNLYQVYQFCHARRKTIPDSNVSWDYFCLLIGSILGMRRLEIYINFYSVRDNETKGSRNVGKHLGVVLT